ncbi:putative autophagy-related protein 11 [Ruditapes philippinarum]|uniref:putative autophagy-related protein 11 n=1 Tax=Ruditapes philippinarum TaxID=129788 RepID=UPI00295AC72F|nr:putative autophagy-related protein 11 [Ruditapes philippinarum]
MQTEGGKRLRIGMVIPCHVGGAVHEHRDRNELLACIERDKEHVTITKLTLQMLDTEGKNEKCCAADEKRASAELSREYAAAKKEITKAEHAKTKNEEAKTKKEEAKTKKEEAKAKVEEAKTKNEEAKAKVKEAKVKVLEAEAKVEELRNKRIFELLKYRENMDRNNLRMILGNETGSMDTTSNLYVRMNTLADSVPSVTDSDDTKRKYIA